MSSVVPALLVDTHIFRVTRRFGWIPEKASVEQPRDLLAVLIPPRLYYRLHLNLIEHGRPMQIARLPRCEVCSLTDPCAYYAQVYRKKGAPPGRR